MQTYSNSKRILVCDDDMGILDVISILLKDNGYHVKLLSNGKAIIKRIEAYNPDLVLLDLWMPGIDGKEITKLLKSCNETKNIPIIIISALDTAKKISKDIGADDFIEKPFDIYDLLNKVKKYT